MDIFELINAEAKVGFAFALSLGILVTAGQMVALVVNIRNPKIDSGEKISWTLVILLFSIFGLILYFFFGRPRPAKDAQTRTESDQSDKPKSKAEPGESWWEQYN